MDGGLALELPVVALASAIGAAARFALGRWIATRSLEHWLMTVGVNLVGCLLAGLLAASGQVLWSGLETALVAGFLGGFTTVSSFSLEALDLWQSARPRHAIGYVLLSLIGSIVFVAIGWQLGSLVRLPG